MANKLITRRFPGYDDKTEAWNFYQRSYNGGEAYAASNLFQYFKEGDAEFEKRLKRAYRENHSKRVVDIVNSYLFKGDVIRKAENKILQDFQQNVDGKNTRIERFMKNISLWSSVTGRMFIVIDKPNTDTVKPMPYAYTLYPQNVLDFSLNSEGKFNWVLVREYFREDEDPFSTENIDLQERYRLWQPGSYILYNQNGEQTDEGDLGIPEVPIIIHDSEEGDLYSGQSLIKDIAYLDRAIFNNWSRLDVIINEQTFSQLIFPIEGLLQDVLNDKKLREKYMTTAVNRILLYSQAASAKPEYIAPDASQAELILKVIERQTKQLFAALGMQGEVVEQTQSAASGVSKAFDFDKLNKLLATKADNLEDTEREMYRLCSLWTGNNEPDVEVDYPDNFDIQSLSEEIAQAQELSLLNVSETFTKEVMKNIVQKALPKIDKETYNKIIEEIENRQANDLNIDRFDFDNEQ